MTTLEPAITFDFRKAIHENRLKGIWKMMVDYRWPYLGATLALAVSALAQTFMYLLLRYFADEPPVIVIGQSTEHATLQAAARGPLPFVVWGGQLPRQRYCTVGTDNVNAARKDGYTVLFGDVTRSELVRDLRTLGVRPEGVLMVHTRMSAIGWVVGGVLGLVFLWRLERHG